MFREFILVKLINGEKATFQTPTFSRKRERTLEMLIKDLYEEYVHDNKLNMLNRRAFSEVLYDAPRTSKLKEDARQIEFVRIGQALKLEAIVRGDAPTSLASASPCTIFKRPPWEPQCFYPTFEHRGTLAGDSFRNDRLFITTDDGTFLVKEDQSHQLILDSTLSVRQLSVAEDHGLMLIRGGSTTNRDNHRIYVFRLKEFQDDIIKVRSRVDVKERRIERTRGCHLYTTAKVRGGYLRMAVAVNRKILLFQWKHTAAWTSWCPNNDAETVDGFIFLKDIQVHDTPSIITLLEGPTNTSNGGLICVGYRHHYEIVCDQTGAATKLHEIETSKRNQTQLNAAVELCDGQETELLLCYNHTCHFQKLNDDISTSEFDFHWNTSPTSIVCAFPYIIAFTSESMEIRLLVNGNLVYTAQMPELQLITSKRDIYFVTTAPEFISKYFHIKGLPVDANTSSLLISNENNHHNFHNSDRRLHGQILTNDDVLKIRHKINQTAQDNSIQQQSQQQEQQCNLNSTNNLSISSLSSPSGLPINQENDIQKLLTIPGRHEVPSIQRACSLQKTRHNSENQKRLISKSNSYGESYTSSSSEKDTTLDEPGAPPNSPKLNSSSRNNSPVSPTKRLPKCRNPFLLNSNSTSNSSTGQNYQHHNNEQGTNSPERIKPLRIYRIPFANLTGAHSHFHAHSTLASSKITKVQNIKIEEDYYEHDVILDNNKLSSSVNNKSSSSDLVLNTNDAIDNISCNCANLSLFTS